MNKSMVFLQLIRPKQWTKNLVVFAGLIFSANFTHPDMLFKVFQAFIIFCTASGAVYIINDVRDLEQDRHHPKKKKRPLAAGLLSSRTALWGAALLVIISLGWGMLLSTIFALAVFIYLILNIAYSFGLKHFVILDVFLIHQIKIT